MKKNYIDKIHGGAVQDCVVAVVIPSYRVTRHIANVVERIPPLVCMIYIVDDMCPDGSGKFAEENLHDPRIRVLYHKQNLGVGGAVMTGYRAAIVDGAEVIVKIDGDDQMDPELIGQFIDPILTGEADYVKGNRFYDLENIRTMPSVRLFGNAVLSFMAKFSTGYWDVFDPTNGYTAISADIARHLPFERISKRYFFETDILFRLNILRAVVVDTPMDAKYGDEISNLKISKVAGEFLLKHIRNFCKRIFYNYYLRNMSVASVELPIGVLLFVFGVLFGSYHWMVSAEADMPTPAGTVMLAALPILVGLQLILAFLGHDAMSVPRRSRYGGRYAAPKFARDKVSDKP